MSLSVPQAELERLKEAKASLEKRVEKAERDLATAQKELETERDQSQRRFEEQSSKHSTSVVNLRADHKAQVLLFGHINLWLVPEVHDFFHALYTTQYIT